MANQTEGRHAGEFILSEANGNRSRETITIASGRSLPAGTVIELSGGKGIGFVGTTASEAVGVLLSAVDASDADAPGVIIARDAEVNTHMLSVPVDNSPQDSLAAAKVGLKSLGVIAR